MNFLNFLFVTWDVDPVIFSLGSREIRWYGLLWAIGFLLTYRLLAPDLRKENCPENWPDKLFTYCIVGTILGARIGHCLFYQPGYYLTHPVEILKIWEGGLASHGGAIGVILAVWLFSRLIAKKSIWYMFDRMMVGVAALCFCIRLGNLMNSEIFGYPTTLPWGFLFVRSHEWHQLYEGLACHPTQIYEMMYCAVAGIVAWVMLKQGAQRREGLITGVGLLIFFGTRFALEFMKNPQVESEIGMTLDIGQWLSIPFILLGIHLAVKAFMNQESPVQKNKK